jgi:hypothetical protein
MSIADMLLGGMTAKKTNTDDFEEKLIRFIVLSQQPLQLVEEPAFIELIACVHPTFSMFTRPTLRAKLLQRYDAYYRSLKDTLQNIPQKLAVSMDVWTTKHSNLPFMGCIGHWIDLNWKRQTVVLAFEHLPGSHTGERLGGALIRILEDFKILQKVLRNTYFTNAHYSNVLLVSAYMHSFR